MIKSMVEKIKITADWFPCVLEITSDNCTIVTVIIVSGV